MFARLPSLQPNTVKFLVVFLCTACVYPTIRFSILPSIDLSIYSSIHPSISPFIHLSNLSLHLSVHSSILPFIHHWLPYTCFVDYIIFLWVKFSGLSVTHFISTQVSAYVYFETQSYFGLEQRFPQSDTCPPDSPSPWHSIPWVYSLGLTILICLLRKT